MNTPLESLFPLAVRFLPGVPSAMLCSALATSADTFLAHSHIWREDFGSFTTADGCSAYDLYAASPIELVTHVFLDGYPLSAVDERQLGSTFYLQRSGRPRYYRFRPTAELRLYPTPDKEYTVTGRAVLRSSRDATVVPDWLCQQYADAIVDGAVWQLARAGGTPWSDAALAATHKARFDREIANARVRDVRGVDVRAAMQVF